MNTSDVAERDFRNLPITEMEARIARFDERWNSAQGSASPTKEWVKKALKRQGGPRCPVRIKRMSVDVIIRYCDELADLFSEFPDDIVGLFPYDWAVGYQAPDTKDKLNVVQAMTSDARWKDEWGTWWHHAYGGVGATHLDHPIKDWGQLDEYLASIPDVSLPARLDAGMPSLKRHSGKTYTLGMAHNAIFERLHSLRGMQNIFMDFYTNEAELRRLIEALANYTRQLVRRWGLAGADGVLLTDDWGTQTGLMISPDMWREYFKPHYKAIFAEAHSFGMDVVLHSCGCVTDIVDDLIDIELDVLDPVQPGAMDIDEVARRFGGRISFSGAVDIQHLLIECTPRQIKDEISRIIDMLGSRFGNGLIIGPANSLTPDIPVANLRALFEACHEQ
ncbi:MAG: uroporphyrinogen decarboxylase family protein [Armatimonadota bacterium]